VKAWNVYYFKETVTYYKKELGRQNGVTGVGKTRGARDRGSGGKNRVPSVGK